MNPDPADLALVIDDPLAPRILAWWDKTRPGPSDVDVDAVCRITRASAEEVEASIERCQLAGLLLEDGIPVVARKWLGTYVAGRMGLAVVPKKRERGSVLVAVAVAIAAMVALTLPVVRPAAMPARVTQPCL